jgi:hypothetical protein
LGLILGFSIPAHAQSRAGAVAGGSGGNGGGMSGGSGGGGGFGGSIGGGGLSGVSFQTLPSTPEANLPSIAVSGSEAEFVPSTFLPFDQAVAAGQEVLDAEHKSVAEAAAENSRAHRLKAKAALVENAAGDAVIATP